jgi:hypothetical protein
MRSQSYETPLLYKGAGLAKTDIVSAL